MFMTEMVLGHLMGDYIAQNNWMALNKSKYDKLGWVACLTHCVIYTLCVCVFMQNWESKWVIAVFLSHS